MNELVAALRKRIEADGLSLRDVEELTGVSFSTISRVCRGAAPSYRVALILDEWLCGNQVKKPKPQATKRFKVGSKTFLVTIEELIK